MDNPDLDKQIYTAFKDGSYFKDARIWYNYKYLYPFTQRSYLLIVAIIALFISSIAAFNVFIVKQIPDKMPFVINTYESVDKFHSIKSLDKQAKAPQLSLTRYLLTEYIKMREEYSPELTKSAEYKKLLRKVKNYSTKNVLSEFQGYIAQNNKYSPLNRYKDTILREVKIVDIELPGNDLTSGKALITFMAIEKKEGKIIKETLWEATINYRMPDIEVIASNNAPLRFLIRSYRVRLLNKDFVS